jgi:tetratricopeptide (TPR) repeat protein
MSPHLERAFVLFEQRRYELADQELRQELSREPGNPQAHALLALCLTRRDQFDDATREAEEAVRLAPYMSFSHYALAIVLSDRGRDAEAERAIALAIMLDPEEPDYATVQATICLNERRWSDALEAAERGLQIDPEHIGCNNLRAKALVKLGRTQEAGSTIDAALARDPENSATHANRGWTLLEQNERERALAHFREALRLDPDNEWARAGIVEALKAKHLVYRLMLRYFLWMSKLSRQMQWAVIIGLLIGQKLLYTVYDRYPTLAPYAAVLIVALLGFIVLAWIADPLFNLLLRVDHFGRLALSREQIVASNWLGVCLLATCAAAVIAVALAVRGSADERFALLAIFLGLLMLPLAGTFNCMAPGPRRFMGAITFALFLAGPGLLMLSFVAPHLDADLTRSILEKFLPGISFSTWLGVALSQIRVRH